MKEATGSVVLKDSSIFPLFFIQFDFQIFISKLATDKKKNILIANKTVKIM